MALKAVIQLNILVFQILIVSCKFPISLVNLLKFAFRVCYRKSELFYYIFEIYCICEDKNIESE